MIESVTATRRKSARVMRTVCWSVALTPRATSAIATETVRTCDKNVSDILCLNVILTILNSLSFVMMADVNCVWILVGFMQTCI